MKRRPAGWARAHLNYATVVTAISVFLLLAGGAAYAATHLAKNSVGTKQLKKNAVTAAKIKKEAVTAAKIKADAVTSGKLKAASLGGSSFDLATTRYSRVVHVSKMSTATTVGEDYVQLPLESPTFTQAAGEDDFFFGTASVSVPPECVGPERKVYVKVDIDSPKPVEAQLALGEVIGETGITMPESGQATEGAPLTTDAWRFAPSAAVEHTLSLTAEAECQGATQTAVVNSAEISVVGTR